MARKLGAALALSFAIHAGVVGGAAAVKEVQKLQRERELERAKNAQVEGQDGRAELIRMKKELLVKEARAAIREGNLSLGKFILEGNRIEAEEKGREFNNVGASAKYREYLSLLDNFLAGKADLRDATPEVLKGIQYFGVAGGNMADLLVEGGGKCDQVSLLIVSLGYDSGYEDRMFLRAYSDHLAPILVEGGDEYDLMAGKKSDGKGVLFPAERLVEMYAAKNGIPPEGGWVAAAPARQDMGGKTGPTMGAAVPDLLGKGERGIFAYPETTDTSEGEVPLFSPVAVAGRGASMGDTATTCISDDDGRTCYESGGRMALIADHIPYEELLNVAPFRRALVSGDMPVMVPSQLPDFVLESISLNIKHFEKKMGKSVNGIGEEMKRLLDIAELVAHYTRAEWHFRSLGNERIVSQIVGREAELRGQAEALISGLEGDGWKRALAPILDDEFPYIRLRLLPFLGESGARLLLGIYEEELGRRAISYECLVALLVNPSTHNEALGIFEKIDQYEQARIAKEFAVYGANLDEDDSELYRAVMAYGSLLDRYDPAKEVYDTWLHGEPKFGKLLRALRGALSENGLGREWEAGFMVYFGEQVTRSRTGMPIFKEGQEAEGMAFVKELDAWLRGVDVSFEEIDKLRSKVRHILSIGRYDRATLIELERCEAGLEPCPE